MSIAIRSPRAADIHEINALLGQLGYPIDVDTLRGRLAGILDSGDHLFLVADFDSHCVGWIHAAVCDYIDSGPFVVIGGLVVDKAHRGRGVGKLLMQRAEGWARDRGLSVVRVWSSEPRKEAHDFYARLGYTHIKTHFAFAKSLAADGQASLAGMVPKIVEDHADKRR